MLWIELICDDVFGTWKGTRGLVRHRAECHTPASADRCVSFLVECEIFSTALLGLKISDTDMLQMKAKLRRCWLVVTDETPVFRAQGTVSQVQTIDTVSEGRSNVDIEQITEKNLKY